MEKKDKKYYFISFAYRTSGHLNFSYAHALIDIHPLEWQIKQYQYRDNNRGSEEYNLLSWKEISKKEYEKYEGQFGN
jgi:hypothetical protein